MIGPIPLLDLLLGVVLLWLVLRMLGTADRFEMVTLYITFGVMMALCWVRLRAPDLALVEAAIGAGLTGTLLLDTLGRLEAAQGETADPDQIAVDAPEEEL